MLACVAVFVVSLAAAHACQGEACWEGTRATKQLPHILFVLVDDFGWGNLGYHREPPSAGVQTPVMDRLAQEGVELNRHYVHMTCTPTRSSLQTGRLPAHITTKLVTPCDINGAIPRNMTGIASVMKRAGYATHHVGKWDAGMTTPHHTPHGRGFDTSLNYFSHGNWMWSEHEWLGSYHGRLDVPVNEGFVDFWNTDRPANDLNGTGYEEELFKNRVYDILHKHDQSRPLFLHYHSKVAHYPMQAPLSYQKKFSFIQEEHNRMYNAMVNYLDDSLGEITGWFKELQMWDNTLMILSTDNGGYVKDFDGPCNTTGPSWPSAGPNTDFGHGIACMNGEAGASNFPLRGGKYSNFEGGIRGNAFISGGFVPKRVRGTKQEGMMHIADWYSTLAEGIAGLDPTDHAAAASGLPPVDSLNMWPMLSGAVALSPRDDIGILVSKDLLVLRNWKYVRGGASMVEAERGGPNYPNQSTASDPVSAHSYACPARGCLFDVVSDVTEAQEVSAQHSDVVAVMKKELDRQAAGMWQNKHALDADCKKAAEKCYNGFYGPWREVDWCEKILVAERDEAALRIMV